MRDEEMWHRFGERFVRRFAERLGQAHEASVRRSAEGLATEMHALAGEAAMLGVHEVAEVARTIERASRRLDTDGEAFEVCGRELGVLDGLLQSMQTVR